MPVPLAELFISVSSDVSAAVSGLNSLNNQINGTTNAFNTARPAALAFEAASAAIGAGLVASVKVAADFEHQMAGVRAVMDPGEVNQFGAALSDLALKLGRDTVFTSREAAAGIEELIKAGIPAADVLNGAGSAALSLAAATGIPVAQAATIAATAMNTFGISASNLGSVVDLLAGTANASAADITQLQFGLQSVGPVATQLGLSLADTTAALGIFANNGLRGQDAGTSLKTMLLNLVPSTKKQTDEFKKLGLITADGSNKFFDAQGHVKNLADISQTLQGALKGMSDEQRVAALQILFGTDAVRAAAILYKTGADGVATFHEAVGKVSAEDAAKTRLDNLEGALQNLGGSIETVQIIIGNLFLPQLKDLANATRGIVDQFSNLSPEVQKSVVVFVGIVGAILGIVGGAVLLGPLIGAMGASFVALGGILAAAAPFILLAGVVIAVLAKAWQANAGNIQGTVARVGAILGNFSIVAQKAFSGDIRGAVDTFIAIIGALVPGLGPIIQNVRTTFSGLADQFGPILSNLGLVFDKVFAGDIGGALDTFRTIIVAAVPGAAGFVDLVGRIATAVGQFAGNIGAGLLDFFTNTLPPILASVGSVGADVGAGLLTFFDTVVRPAAEAALAFAGDIGAGLLDFFTNTLPLVLSSAAGVAADVGAGLVHFFTVDLPAAAGGAAQITTATFGPVVDFFKASAPVILDGASKFSAQAAIGVGDFFAQLVGVKDQLGELLPLFGSLANFFSAVFEFDAAVARLQAKVIGNVFGQIADGLKAFSDQVAPAGGPIDTLATSLGTLQNFLQPLADFFNNAAAGIRNFSKAIDEIPASRLPGGKPDPNPAPTPNLDELKNNPPFGLNPDLFNGTFTKDITKDTPIFRPHDTAFTPGAGGGAVVNFNAPISISGGVGLADFVDTIANAINGSTRRVNPPVPQGQPGLVASTV